MFINYIYRLCIFSIVFGFCIGNCGTVTSVRDGGKYFDFMPSDLSAILGNHIYGSTYDVLQWRAGAIIQAAATVMIWDDFGRYNPHSVSAAGDWESGDKFCVKGA